jgi:hypothetical protein
MKGLTQKQIEQVKQVTAWTSTKVHGNTKRIGVLPVTTVRLVAEKKISRQVLKMKRTKETPVQLTRRLIAQYKGNNSSYAKVMIEGNTGIYLASPAYGHSDYNKSRLFDKNEKTLRLMEIFNNAIKA